MRSNVVRKAMLLVLVLGLSGITGCTKREKYTVGGAAAGAAVGYAVTGRGEGAAIGAGVGGLIGNQMGR